MEQDFIKYVTITSKGQLTLPVAIRKALKLNSRRKVRVSVKGDGTVNLAPLPDIMEFYGIAKSKVPYNPREKELAWETMAQSVMRRDRKKTRK